MGSVIDLHEIRYVFVRHNATPWIERVRHGIVQQVGQIAGVNVGEAEQTPRKIRWIVVGTEYAAELLVEYPFCTLSKWKQRRKLELALNTS